MKKRLLSIILTSLLLLASCAEDKTAETEAGATSAETVAPTSSESETEPDEPKVNWQSAGIEKQDFEGRAFNVLLKEYTNASAWHYVALDEINGEVLNDAIVQRNQVIENEFNVDITEVNIKDTIQAFKNTAMSNDGAYDTTLQPITDLLNVAKEGYVVDWNTMPNVDLSKPWWDQAAVSQLPIKGKLYYCTGDISPLANLRVFSFVFNKDMCRELGIDLPYDMVFEGKWTFDEFSKYVTDVNRDMNGDGQMNYDDRWGFFSQNGSSWMMYIAGGGRVLEINDLGEPELVMQSEENMNRAMKALEIIIDKNKTLMADPLVSSEGGSWTVASKWFAEGNALIRSTAFEAIPRDYREMDADFGILPFPKFDEAQKNYCTPTEEGANMFAVPITADQNFVGTILEVMAAESVETVSVAFYNECLEGKTARDEESIDVLDIMFSNKIYDYGLIADIPDFNKLMRDQENKGSTEVASAMKSVQKIAKRSIEKLLEDLEENGIVE